MDLIREYLLSVTAAALLCGVIQSLTGEKGSSAGFLQLVCGIFLSLTVIRPLSEIQIKDFTLISPDILTDARTAVEDGEDYAERAMARHIKEEAEAYILTKARELGADLSLDVAVSDDDPPIPIAVTLTGQVSIPVRHQLTNMIETDLGIREEDQKWIISNSSS